MTVTITCSQITIVSPLLLPNNQSVTLNLYKDCSTDVSYTHTIPAATTSSYVVTSSSWIGSDFPTGVYRIELVIKNVSGEIYKEYLCKYLDCNGTECDVLKDITKVDRVIAYYALQASNNCPQCSCLEMCRLNSIVTESNECQCGCC